MWWCGLSVPALGVYRPLAEGRNSLCQGSVQLKALLSSRPYSRTEGDEDYGESEDRQGQGNNMWPCASPCLFSSEEQFWVVQAPSGGHERTAGEGENRQVANGMDFVQERWYEAHGEGSRSRIQDAYAGTENRT